MTDSHRHQRRGLPQTRASTRRLIATLGAAALLLAVGGSVSAADEVFSGTLRGANEVPPVTTRALGTAYVFINDAETEVKYAVSYTGLSGPLIAAHIHLGPAGMNGPIALPITIGSSTLFGTLTRADFQSSSAASTWAAALDAIRAGRGYVNLHTAANPAGEVRAQLAAPATVPSPTPSPTPTVRPTIRPTPTARPTNVASPTAQPPAAAPAIPAAQITPPPTSTSPDSNRGTTGNLATVALVLFASVLSGLVASWRLQTPRRSRDDWD